MAEGVIRRKLTSARAEPSDGGPGADRGWRVALARAARDHLKLPLEVKALALSRAGLAEVLELPPDLSLLAVLEGPGEGLGVLVLSPDVVQAMIEALTLGKLATAASAPRKPTRTDAAMVAPMIDAALVDLEETLADEADLVWAGSWRYASFIDDPRPLGLMLEDFSYRVLRAEVDLGHGQRQGQILMILPADGRGKMPTRGAKTSIKDEAHSQIAFSIALADEVEGAECQLQAVLMRLSMPLSKVVGLAVGDILPLNVASLDKVSVEGLDGRRLAEGKLGQNRGMRALRLTVVAAGSAQSAQPSQPLRPAQGAAVDPGFRQSA